MTEKQQLVPVADDRLEPYRQRALRNFDRHRLYTYRSASSFQQAHTEIINDDKAEHLAANSSVSKERLTEQAFLLKQGLNEIITNCLTSIALGEKLHDTHPAYSKLFPQALAFLDDMCERMVGCLSLTPEEAEESLFWALAEEYLRKVDDYHDSELLYILKRIYPKLKGGRLSKYHPERPMDALDEAIFRFLSHRPQTDTKPVFDELSGQFHRRTGEITINPNLEPKPNLKTILRAGLLGTQLGLNMSVVLLPASHTEPERSVYMGLIGFCLIPFLLQMKHTIKDIEQAVHQRKKKKHLAITLAHEVNHQLSSSHGVSDTGEWVGKAGIRRYRLYE